MSASRRQGQPGRFRAPRRRLEPHIASLQGSDTAKAAGLAESLTSGIGGKLNADLVERYLMTDVTSHLDRDRCAAAQVAEDQGRALMSELHQGKLKRTL